MALEIKQSLKLGQSLVITPQLQQAIKLLQLSRVELADLIQKELLENPILEENASEDPQEAKSEENTSERSEKALEQENHHDHTVDEVGSKEGEFKEPADFDWENYLNSFSSNDYKGERESIASSDEQPSYENFIRQTESLQDHLLWQLHLGSFDKREVAVGTEIIGNINEDAYLTTSCEEIAQKTKEELHFVEHVLARIQEFDPIGVAARSLTECLLLQAKHLVSDTSKIGLLLNDYLLDLERRDYHNINKKTGFSLEEIQELARLISSLDPKPGRPYSPDNAQYITPDVYIQNTEDGYLITLNEDGLPRLQISNLYRKSMMKGASVNGDTKSYIQERLKAATWLIKSIHQRQRTLYRVTKSIVKFQKEFFDHGVHCLKPLTLKEVADDIEMHESTISRVTTNKYVHSPRGIFELKYFFNSSIQMVEGGGVASEAVKAKIKDMVSGEDAKRPLSDQKISDLLKHQNIDIARRTVAKYREVLGIQPSSKRKRRFP
ncbi:MAG: RNA polymerase sigma-54 factor [Deltaproteobacteria bacterium CG_4_10_14_0_2_um_filter_43_8]|nr:MAG: RNA polymerase sigma-54 factor [Deltaproteobacteria bacterium CG11_big_fil_rev_8_21_14_0_20_42_23]PJA18751.1 MAG: RNA polymerase sigma-54 factor [Deltaproteobacteria bacterium CG_4_10_14_0_2_um_filter_43_8]PJC64385.1 MAG: RNA polymerase sigma-54 factor [Deltaproteobacteria bacterium CG_4_9_14_0_2_um_filter_42_21]